MIELLDEFRDTSVKATAGASSAPAADTADSAEPRRATVLLATARRSLVTWFRVALATAGLSLMVSPDGLHALMSAVREPPELVILDDDLPGVDADQVEHLLQRDIRTAGARVVHVRVPLSDTDPGREDDRAA